MQIDPKKSIIILSHEEQEDMKEYALKLLDMLPKEPMTALLTISFLKKTMEESMNKTVEDIKIFYSD